MTVKEETDEELWAIVNAWSDPNLHHVPGCRLDVPDFQSYCLDCHVTAYNALQELKRRYPEGT